jgi:hypothetical protein
MSCVLEGKEQDAALEDGAVHNCGMNAPVRLRGCSASFLEAPKRQASPILAQMRAFPPENAQTRLEEKAEGKIELDNVSMSRFLTPSFHPKIFTEPISTGT